MANNTNDTILKFTPDGVSTVFATTTGGNHPFGLAIDSSNNVFVTNQFDKIFEYTPDGRGTVFATGLLGASFLAIRPSVVPEPWALVLMGIGVAGLLAFRRRTAAQQGE